MRAAGRFPIVLAKEDFKFACAHFTVFGEGRAELLGGHNYRVAVLPIANTTMELLAATLWDRLAPALASAGDRIDTLAVAGEESAGQRCVFERRLAS